MFQSVLRSFTLSRGLIVFFAVLGYFVLPSVQQGISVPLTEPSPWFLSIWYQWDANWYMSIAANGYEWVPGDQSNVAFFPLYPWTVRALGIVLGGRYLLAGLLLSSACLFGAMAFLHRLVRQDFGESVARRAVLLLAIFPTSVFFSSLYTESMFLLTSVATFYYARNGRWAAAGGWGLLASLTRITGLWLILPLAWEYASQKKFSPARLSPAALWLMMLPAGLLIYMGYLYLGFGRPLAFAETQVSGWGHGFTTVWGSLSRDVGFLLDQSELWVIYELAATGLLLACLILGLKKLRGSYNLYMLVSLAVPLIGGTTKSMSRYLLVVFPIFIIMALYTGKLPVRYAAYGISVALLAISTVAFVTGRWVA